MSCQDISPVPWDGANNILYYFLLLSLGFYIRFAKRAISQFHCGVSHQLEHTVRHDGLSRYLQSFQTPLAKWLSPLPNQLIQLGLQCLCTSEFHKASIAIYHKAEILQ